MDGTNFKLDIEDLSNSMGPNGPYVEKQTVYRVKQTDKMTQEESATLVGGRAHFHDGRSPFPVSELFMAAFG